MGGITDTRPTETAPPRRLKPLVMLIIMVLPLVIVAVLGWALIEANRTQLSSGLAPNFTIRTYDGGVFNLGQQRGKVVLINFWASWCGPCRTEAPDLNAIWDEYKGRDFAMVGVGYLDNESDARAFIKEFGVTYPTGPDNGSTISGAYRVKGVPETYIVDKAGYLVKVIIAPINADDLRPILDRLLAEDPTGVK